MNSLVSLKGNDVFTDSLVIANGTKNEHESVAALIKKYTTDFEDFGRVDFTDLKSGKRGRPTRVYQLNEGQATLLITYLDNNIIVRDFKKKLVQQFLTLRNELIRREFERQSKRWQSTRLESKTNRRMETDEIKVFVQYAFNNGSKSAEKYYMNFTKLANQAVGIEPKSRDVATASQLNTLILIEHIIGQVIVEGLGQELDYKDIFQSCKKRVDQFKEIAYLQIAG